MSFLKLGSIQGSLPSSRGPISPPWGVWFHKQHQHANNSDLLALGSLLAPASLRTVETLKTPHLRASVHLFTQKTLTEHLPDNVLGPRDSARIHRTCTNVHDCA